MDFLQPTTWREALEVRAERPDAVPIAGGTDVMVDINFDRSRPGALLDLGRVGELREWTVEAGTVRLGAAVPYSRIVDDLGVHLPGLAMASRTVGSPQIRTRRCWPPGPWSRSRPPPAAPAGSRPPSSTPA